MIWAQDYLQKLDQARELHRILEENNQLEESGRKALDRTWENFGINQASSLDAARREINDAIDETLNNYNKLAKNNPVLVEEFSKGYDQLGEAIKSANAELRNDADIKKYK
jgi:hypothetical protein